MAEIVTKDITEAAKSRKQEDGLYAVHGEGVFDDLMESVSLHLDAQFKNDRLEGSDYATVYLGALQNTLQQSIAYLLGRQLADKQAELVEEQTRHEIIKEALTTAQTDLVISQTEHEELKKDLTLAQTALVNAQKEHEELKKDLTIAQTANITADTALKGKQEDKLDEEINFILAKIQTEKAQTEDIAVDGSVLQAQIDLYGEQAKGFRWNAQQKILKTMNDTWAVNINVGGEKDDTYNALVSIDSVYDNAVDGLF